MLDSSKASISLHKAEEDRTQPNVPIRAPPPRAPGGWALQSYLCCEESWLNSELWGPEWDKENLIQALRRKHGPTL